MILALVVVGSLACYLGLSLISDRTRGTSFSQIGTALGAILLFVALPQGDSTVDLLSRPDPILGLGIGVLSATAAAMGYHLYLGRFKSVWVARSVFLTVSFGIAASFVGFLALVG